MTTVTKVRVSINYRVMIAMLVIAFLLGDGALAAKTLRFFWAGFTPDQIAYLQKEAFPEFEKKHGVKIIDKNIGWAVSHEQQLALAAAAGTSPDVVELGANYHITENKFLRPLDGYIASWNERDQIIQPLWEMKRYQGKIWAVPLNGETRVLCYHVPLYEEVGLDAKKPPQSWQELLTAVRKLTKIEGNKITRLGLNMVWELIEYRWFALQAGRDVVDDENNLSLFDSREAHEALSFFVELYQTVYPPGFTVALPSNDPYAWGMGLTGNFQSLAAAIDTPFASFAPRRSPTSPEVALAFVNALGVTKECKQPDLAWKFIEFLLSRDVQLELTKLGGQTPFRMDIIKAISEQPQLFPRGVLFATRVTYTLLPKALSGAPGLFTAALRGKLNPYLLRALRKEIPVEQALAEMHRECKLYIDTLKK